ncbi:hypothetical protein FAZ95_38530 [Trinickia violacea]|uniref:Uncharacterized protein n=1 Tax=Trinickia violacea TaxID=2571746 RepID=A0A4P8IZF0_9BURK|nr:hypothetical protein [Trinickia violacea]QCP54752.1 hypothetical protein FAZ95_38530 [Trinickia violacea]
MRQATSSQPAAADPVENWSQCLPGFQLTHIIHLVSVASRDVVARVKAYLSEQEASVSDFVVLRSGDVLDQKIVLDGIGERRAKALREQLLILDGVLRIRVEHCFVRRPGLNGAA